MTTDRVVHAVSADGTTEVTRYDRAGKWFVEISVGASTGRMPVTLDGAVDVAFDLEADGGRIHLGRAGGGRFDATVACRRAQARSQAPSEGPARPADDR